MVKGYVKCGHIISFSDGKIEGVISEVCDDGIKIEFTKVDYVLRQNAGCTILGDDIPSPKMTHKVCDSISRARVIQEKMVEWVILSFVESADEIKDFVDEMHEKGLLVMAKIETAQGVENIASIGLVVDGFMIGRGDLKSTTKELYPKYYDRALSSVSKCSSLYNGVGTFFLDKYSQTLEFTNDQLYDLDSAS